MQLDNWIRSIAERRWPILPNTLNTIHSMCARNADLLNLTDLANLTLSDPLLLFDLLRVIGSSRALQRSETMPSIEQSMILMGLESVQNRFVKLQALGTSDPFSAEVREAVGMWLARSRVAALVVKGWLSLTDEIKVEDCFIAALLYNLPACFFLMTQNTVPHRPLLHVVSESVGMDYPKLLERFVQELRLPTLLLGLLGSGQPSHRKQLLRLAVATANGLEGYWRSPWVTGITAAASLVNSSFDCTYQIVMDAITHVARSPRSLEYGYPARELLFLPKMRDGVTATPYENKKAEPHPSPLPHSQDDEVVKEVMYRLSHDLKFRRVLYLRYSPEQNVLKLRYQMGLEEENPLCRIRVKLDTGSFFALLTSKPQSFHAPAKIREKLMRVYKDEFFHHIGDHEFAAATVFRERTLAGVFYADHGYAGLPISQEDYQQFKKFVMHMADHH